jgi:enamine deaminase RidA (YjgF/YER057c/UK114 family)
MRQNVFPPGLSRRVVAGNLLYAPVVHYVLGEHVIIFVSGLLSRDAEGAVVGTGDMGAQIAQVGENLATALASIGANLGDLVRTSTYVTDIDEFFRHTDVRKRYFGVALPTSTTVEVRRLSDPAFMVEVEGFAIMPAARLIRESS